VQAFKNVKLLLLAIYNVQNISINILSCIQKNKIPCSKKNTDSLERKVSISGCKKLAHKSRLFLSENIS
jgi:hypothetical protein